uniref:Protein kinase domain-containing protein n=1 Tax=Xenopus tropicalis TaxID=8364 RepID=A0A803JP95_XENTR
MDYLSGGSLYDFYQRNKPLNINTIRFLAAEMICGLKSLHSMGYIHRDLKLENVLLDSRGHAKIADFGLAAHMINGKAKGCVGTRGYVAPEVLCRDKYDYTVDYYSLGVILFRMATGLKLEQEPTPESKAQIHSMSPELRDFILKLVCDNPEERMRFVCSIKDHPFLGPIDWEALENRKLKPPYIMVSTFCLILPPVSGGPRGGGLDHDRVGLGWQENWKKTGVPCQPRPTPW